MQNAMKPIHGDNGNPNHTANIISIIPHNMRPNAIKANVSSHHQRNVKIREANISLIFIIFSRNMIRDRSHHRYRLGLHSLNLVCCTRHVLVPNHMLRKESFALSSLARRGNHDRRTYSHDECSSVPYEHTFFFLFP